MYNPQPGDKIEVVDTPAMLVDLDLMEANISKMMGHFRDGRVAVRSHLKTAKSPPVAFMLLEAGVRGICVAKLSEAEVMVEAGIEDILITCEIAGAVKVARLMELLEKQPGIKVVVDSRAGAEGLEQALKKKGGNSPLQILIDVNVGQNRTGIEPGSKTLELANTIRGLPHLKLVGVQGYEGHLQHLHDPAERETRCREAMAVLTGTAQLLREAGHPIETVTTAGTGTALIAASCEGVTEVQPGSFIFMDRDYRDAIGPVYANALTIISTVISKPAPHRVVIDAGLKALTTDSGFAVPKNHTNLNYRPGGDEHGILEGEGGEKLEIGDRIEMIPGHIDPTINLHDFYYAHRKGVIEQIWPVAARGKIQ